MRRSRAALQAYTESIDSEDGVFQGCQAVGMKPSALMLDFNGVSKVALI